MERGGHQTSTRPPSQPRYPPHIPAGPGTHDGDRVPEHARWDLVGGLDKAKGALATITPTRRGDGGGFHRPSLLVIRAWSPAENFKAPGECEVGASCTLRCQEGGSPHFLGGPTPLMKMETPMPRKNWFPGSCTPTKPSKSSGGTPTPYQTPAAQAAAGQAAAGQPPREANKNRQQAAAEVPKSKGAHRQQRPPAPRGTHPQEQATSSSSSAQGRAGAQATTTTGETDAPPQAQTQPQTQQQPAKAKAPPVQVLHAATRAEHSNTAARGDESETSWPSEDRVDRPNPMNPEEADHTELWQSRAQQARPPTRPNKQQSRGSEHQQRRGTTSHPTPDEAVLMQRQPAGGSRYTTPSTQEARAAAARARRCLLRILELTQGGGETHLQAQQALAALQPPVTSEDTPAAAEGATSSSSQGTHQGPLPPGCGAPPPPNPLETAENLLEIACATIVALNEMGADVQTEDVAQDLRQIQRLILEGSRQFHTARKARDWAAVHGGENYTERASEVCSNLLGAINSAPPGHPPYLLDAMERLLYLTNEANLLHQQVWGTNGEEERDLATAEEYRPLRKRARHQADVISHGGGPDTQPETLPEPRQELPLMAMRKLHRLMPFLTGDTQNLASEALQDLCQWSMQFWGDVVFLVESDQEEADQRRTTSEDQTEEGAHNSLQPELPGGTAEPLPRPPLGALPQDPARPLLPDTAGELPGQGAQGQREVPGTTTNHGTTADTSAPPAQGHQPPPELPGGVLALPPQPPVGALPREPARPLLPDETTEQTEPKEAPLRELPGGETRGPREVPETTTNQETTTDHSVQPAQGLQPLQGLPQLPGQLGTPPRLRPLPQHGALPRHPGLPQLPTTTTQLETTEEDQQESGTTGRPEQPLQEPRPRRPRPERGALRHDQGLPQLPGTTTQQEKTTETGRSTTANSGAPTQQRPRPLPPRGAQPHGQELPQPATTTQQRTTREEEEERPGNEATGRPGQPPQELRPQPGAPTTGHTTTTEESHQDGGPPDCQATAEEPDSAEADTVPWHPHTTQWRTALAPPGEADLSESESGQSHRRRRVHAAFDT